MTRDELIAQHATASLAVMNLDAAIIQLGRLGMNTDEVVRARRYASIRLLDLQAQLFVKPRRRGRK